MGVQKTESFVNLTFIYNGPLVKTTREKSFVNQ